MLCNRVLKETLLVFELNLIIDLCLSIRFNIRSIGHKSSLNIVHSILLAHQRSVLGKEDVVSITDVCYHLRIKYPKRKVFHLLDKSRTVEYPLQIRHRE